jgi:hypothetical protein
MYISDQDFISSMAASNSARSETFPLIKSRCTNHIVVVCHFELPPVHPACFSGCRRSGYWDVLHNAPASTAWYNAIPIVFAHLACIIPITSINLIPLLPTSYNLFSLPKYIIPLLLSFGHRLLIHSFLHHISPKLSPSEHASQTTLLPAIAPLSSNCSFTA